MYTPSSTEVISMGGLVPDAGRTPDPEQHVGRHDGEQLLGQAVMH